MTFEINQKKQSGENIVKYNGNTLSKAFSPKDKLFLLCSPLGGYSLLDDTKYNIRTQ